ncbi:MAG: YecA family protein [Candidatus Nanopelagicales bacterium]
MTEDPVGSPWGEAFPADEPGDDLEVLSEAMKEAGLGVREARLAAAAVVLIDLADGLGDQLAAQTIESLAEAGSTEPPLVMVAGEVAKWTDRLPDAYEMLSSTWLASHALRLEDVVASFSTPDLPVLVAAYALGDLAAGPLGLTLFLGQIDFRGPRSVRAALKYLRGREFELAARPLEAEALYRDCLALTRDHSGALIRLAGLAIDRGDDKAARAAIQRSGVREHPFLSFLDNTLRVDRDGQSAKVPPGVTRNQPCPCGSGRKFKMCHGQAREVETTLHEQALVLYDKAVTYLLANAPDYLDDLLTEDYHQLDAADADAQLTTALDAALFFDGKLEEYEHLRAALLSQPERDLLAAWLTRDPGVFEVLGVEPGSELELRDLRSGETLTVAEVAGSERATVGMNLFTRVAEVGEQLELYGGIVLIDPADRDELASLLDAGPDAVDVMAFLSGPRSAPVPTDDE